MADLLSSQLTQLAFAVVTGQHRLTDDQRAALADLSAAAAHVARASAPRGTLALVPQYIDSVDRSTLRVRVAKTPAGAPGPWLPINDFDFPQGAYPGYPCVPKVGTPGGYQYHPGGAWFHHPGYQPPADPSTKPTLRPGPAPAPPRCECGSNEPGCHSTWCPLHTKDGR